MRKTPIYHWVNNFRLSNSTNLIKCYLFGSFVTKNSFNDVDTILIFNEWQVRQIVLNAKVAFWKDFQLNLHTQIFHCSQNEKINKFIERAKFVREVL